MLHKIMPEYIGNLDINKFISLDLLNISLDFNKLSEEILQNNEKIHLNPLHTNHEDTILPKDLPNSEISKFLKIINDFFKKDNLKLAGVWSHVHYPLESTNTHNHNENHHQKSFVFYVNVPLDSGKFVIDLSIINGPRIPISPVQGNLLLFPPWLPHLVTKNYANEPRISISGNLEILN
tara:strand:- start:572 stop:1108 length:537 start_codon:yes stop_codon:yes gene_type:complete